MIDADDASARRYGVWPWDRTVHGELLDFLKDSGAAVVAYDILFALPMDSSKDSRLAESTVKAGNVVYPVAVNLTEKETLHSENQILEPYLWDLSREDDSVENFFWTQDLISPLPELIHDEGIGHIATNRDSDGMVRRVPLLVRHNDKLIPSLAFQAVLKFMKVPRSKVTVNGTSIIIKQATLPGKSSPQDIKIPIDDHGQMIINFAGQWRETFKHASFASVLSPPSENTPGNVEDLEDKIVVVANTLSGNDIKSVPIAKTFPGAGIHANIINTILTQNFLRETSSVFNILLIVLLSFATSRILFSRQYFQKIILISLLAGGYLAVGIFLFFAGVIVDLFLPLFSVGVTALLVSVYQSVAANKVADALFKEKRNVESRMASVSRNLTSKEIELEETQQLLNQLQEGLLEGKKREEVEAHRINELQSKFQSAMEEKTRLLREREELEKKFLDLQIEESRDEPSLEDRFQALREECKKYGIISQSRKIFEAFDILKQYAAVPSPVLILGESGTGKELFARALHQMSPRKNKNFIAVNMGAIPRDLVESELFGHAKGSFTSAIKDKKGKFSLADGGTIFLDEIGDTQLDAQVKLLRVLQEKEVQPVGGESFKIDTRVITATHRVLEDEIKNGSFREDLFYRLNALKITLPPLRERKEDIPFLVQHFVEKYSSEYGKPLKGVSDQAMKKLLAHEWKGNVREMENVIQRGVTLASKELIQEKDLGLEDEGGPDKKPKSKVPLKKGEVGDELLLDCLREKGFEINETAAQLNMSRNTVSSRFKGICFELLVKNNFDRQKVTEVISNGLPHQPLVHQKLVEYHENLINNIKDFDHEEEAFEAVLKRSKNIPSQYHSAIRQLVRQSFLNRNT